MAFPKSLDPDRGAVVIADHELIPRRHVEDLVVGVDGKILQGPVDRALGGVDRAGDDLGADIVDLQAESGDLARIDADANGRLLLSGDGDEAHAIDA